MPHFFCVKCGQKIDADASMAGVSLPCPACKYQLSVPPLGAGATRLPPLSTGHQPAPTPAPAAIPTPAPWQVESQQPQPQYQQPSQRTRSRRASGNPRQLIIGSVIAIAAVIGLFAGLNTWHQSKSTTDTKPADTQSTAAAPSPASAVVPSPSATPPAVPAPTPSPAPATTPPPPTATATAEPPIEDGWVTTDFQGLRARVPKELKPETSYISREIAHRFTTREWNSLKGKYGKVWISLGEDGLRPQYIKSARKRRDQFISYERKSKVGELLDAKQGEITVSGHEAAYAEVLTMAGDTRFQSNLLYITHGTLSWTVAVYGDEEEVGPVWKRLLAQLEIPSPIVVPPAPPMDEKPFGGWVITDFHGLRLELPSAPEKETSDPELASDPLVAEGGAHQAMIPADGYALALYHVTFKTTADLQAAVDEGVERVTSAHGGSEFETHTEKTTISGRPAMVTETSYMKEGERHLQNFLTVADGNDLWVVVILGLPRDATHPWERIVVNASLGGKTGGSAPLPPTPGKWAIKNFHDLEIEIPDIVTPNTEPLPPTITNRLEKDSHYLSTGTLGETRITLNRLITLPGHVRDIRSLRDKDFDIFSTGTKGEDFRTSSGEMLVSGHHAVFSESSATVSGRRHHYYKLRIAIGPILWSVTADGPGDQTTAIWERLIGKLALPKRSRSDAKVPVTWVITNFHELTMVLPKTLKPNSNPPPAEIAAQLVPGTWKESTAKVESCQISVSHMVYKTKPDAEVLLENAIKQHAAESPLEYTKRGKLPFTDCDAAVCAELSTLLGSKFLYYQNILIITKGAEVWQVELNGFPEDTYAIWDRITTTDAPVESAVPAPDPAAPPAPSTPAPEETPTDDDWVTTDFHGLRLKVPEGFQPQEDPLPPSVAARIIEGTWKTSGVLLGESLIRINHRTHKQGASLPNPDALITATLGELSEFPSVSKYETKRNKTTISGRDAFHAEVTFLFNDEPKHHHLLYISQGPDLWYLSILGPAEEVPDLWKRLRESIEFPNVSDSPAPAQATDGWAINEFHGLQLNLPGLLTPSDEPTPPDVAKEIVGGRWDHSILLQPQYMVDVIHSTAKGVSEVDLRRMADGAVKGAGKPDGITNLRSTTGEITVSGHEAVYVDMSYDAAGIRTHHHCLIIAKGPEIWYITIAGDAIPTAEAWKRIRKDPKFANVPPLTPPPTGSSLTEKPAADGWITTNIHGLRLRLPGEPKPSHDSDMPAGDNWRQSRVSMTGYGITIAHTTYKNGHVPKLSDILQGTIDGVSSNPSVGQLKSSHTEITISGQKALAVEMSYVVQGVPCQQNVIIIVRGSENWFIEVAGRATAVSAPWKIVRDNVALK